MNSSIQYGDFFFVFLLVCSSPLMVWSPKFLEHFLSTSYGKIYQTVRTTRNFSHNNGHWNQIFLRTKTFFLFPTKCFLHPLKFIIFPEVKRPERCVDHLPNLAPSRPIPLLQSAPSRRRFMTTCTRNLQFITYFPPHHSTLCSPDFLQRRRTN